MRRLRLPESIAADVEVWRVDLNLRSPVPEADWALLAGDEGERALRLHRHQDKVRFVRTRAALRRLLAGRLRCRPQDLRFATGPFGKPRLAAGSDGGLDFNASHAGGFALIALAARGSVGVDIERRDPGLDGASLEPVVASPLERRLPAGQRPEFFERWVVKEAVLKAMGLGVAQHLQDVSVLAPPSTETRRYGLHCAAAGWPPLGAWRLPAPPGYASAIAWTARSISQLP